MVAHAFYVHFAVRNAQAAVRTVFFVHLDAQKGDAVKEAVNRAERTDKAAEEAIDKDRQNYERRQHAELPGKQRSEVGVHARVVGVDHQHDCAAERTRGADVFAEAGQLHIPIGVNQRDCDHQHGEEHVFQIGQHAGNAALFQFGGADFIQQVLPQTHGAKESADGAGKNQPEQRQNTDHVIGCARVGFGKRVLQRTERARTDRPRTGIAIEAGDAQVFRGFTVVNLPRNKPFDICIVQQRGVHLYQPALARQVV